MKHFLRVFVLVGILFGAGAAPGQPQPSPTPEPIEGKSQEWQDLGVLLPGQTLEYQGVKISMEAANGTSTESATSKKQIDLVGPKRSIRAVEFPQRLNENIYAFLDGIIFGMRPRRNPNSETELGVTATPEPLVFHFDSTSGKRSIFVSKATPVTVDDWTLSVADTPAKSGSGETGQELQIRNRKTSEVIAMPAVAGAARDFGRFHLSISDFYKSSRTAHTMLGAKPDTTVRGAGAYVARELYDSRPAGELLESLAKKYGFSVEWVAFPVGHPESIEYAKMARPSRTQWDGANITVKAFIDDVASGADRAITPLAQLAVEWKDPTHLRVWAKNYDKVVAEQEKKQKEKSEADQAIAEFEKKYQPETRAYPLEKIAPATAKTLIEAELGAFYLMPEEGTNAAQKKDTGTEFSAGDPFLGNSIQLEEKIGRFGVLYFPLGGSSAKSDSSSQEKKSPVDEALNVHARVLGQIAQRKIFETAIADDRANAILVTALPATHERIKQVLARVDNLLAKTEASPTSLTQYRVEVILLEGKPKTATADATGLGGTVPVTTSSAGTGANILDPRKTHVVFGNKHYAVDRIGGAGPDGILIHYIETTSTLPSQSKSLDIPFAPNTAFTAHDVQNQEIGRGGKYALRIQYRAIHPSALVDAHQAAKPLESYGLSKEDLATFQFDAARELGRSVMTLSGERGETGKAYVALAPSYAAELEFLDVRPPYLITKARIVTPHAAPNKGSIPVVENTLFMEKGKPAVLGVTNMREGLILIAKLQTEAR